ncbi:hypothetical protein OM416_20375 [Paenibacillus sp. LS1]|uniref:hypothetical protein n=1 Tax=Paenibacillus sp. LS1 TaxID=2992120 RepID=UPI00223068DF|nr:hypothetical protein [Paenibacillus sp. LS1]MCW3793954.1 hypothetical protein [Paenibacillus sp. LS1]
MSSCLVFTHIISEAEENYQVSLKDDPTVEAAVRDLVRKLAKMKITTLTKG